MQHLDDDAERMQHARLAGNDRGSDFAVSQAAPETPAAIEATAAKEEPVDAEDGLHHEVLVEDASEATWRILRKRRLLPGALTSEEDFGNLFETLGAVNVQVSSWAWRRHRKPRHNFAHCAKPWDWNQETAP